jgi:hypothetical protein
VIIKANVNSKKEEINKQLFFENVQKSDTNFIESYGEITFKMHWYNLIEQSIINSNSIRVFESSKLVIINNQSFLFKDLIQIQLEDNSKTIYSTSTTSSSENTVGRALVGGLLFGSTGAIIGGVTSRKESEQNENSIEKFKLKITINDLKNPIINFDFSILTRIVNDKNEIVSGFIYKEYLQKMISTLSVIIHRNELKLD